jgi:hypothetical protein
LALPEKGNKSLLMAMMEADPTPPMRNHNPADATGFIRLNALRLRVAAKVQRKK